jgi:hypothetical protein
MSDREIIDAIAAASDMKIMQHPACYCSSYRELNDRLDAGSLLED